MVFQPISLYKSHPKAVSAEVFIRRGSCGPSLSALAVIRSRANLLEPDVQAGRRGVPGRCFPSAVDLAPNDSGPRMRVS